MKELLIFSAILLTTALNYTLVLDKQENLNSISTLLKIKKAGAKLKTLCG